MNVVAHPAAPPRPGLFKRLGASLVVPAVFDFWASRLHSTWSWDRPLARIVGRRVESCDSTTLLLQPNRHWTGFRPGQHMNIGAEIDGTRIVRSYSPSDAPRADGRIAITVKAIPGGRLSRHLCRDAKIGDVLTLGQAFGGMTLPDPPEGRWLFLAGGSGITPLMAMIRAQAAAGMPVPIALMYWAGTRDALCFVDELRALAARHADFHLDLIVTRDDASSDVRHGRIDTVQLSAFVPDLHQRRVFACGPNDFVATARALTEERAAAFRAEAFTPAPWIADDDADAGEVTLTLALSGHTLDVPRGVSLLSALEAAGLQPASGCRMGICNTCACGKRAGTTRHLQTGGVEHEPVSALRLCVNSARSDLTLEL
ncbi:MAG: ferredoxin reductase [Lysobacteraceae bacterium]|nr:MAG: ferredoxin reductase [Xanthomonadaceae bacterium]